MTSISGGTDCDDTNAAVNPGATEVCNLIDDNCDGVVDENQGACYDTGLQVVWYAGEGRVNPAQTRFISGRFGYDITTWKSLPELDSVCEAMGTWTSSGPRLTTCTFCDWAFNLTVSSTVATGDYCDDYGLTDGVWDGFAAGWGFQDLYSYAYAGNTYDYSDIVMYYYATYATWYVFSYNYTATVGGVTYGPYGYNTLTGTTMTFHQPYGVFSYYYPYP